MSDPMMSMFMLLRDVIGKLTAPGTGKEYGVTIDDIVADLLLYGVRNATENAQQEFRQQTEIIQELQKSLGFIIFHRIPRDSKQQRLCIEF